MVSMHVHKMGDMRAPDIHAAAEKKYMSLVQAFKNKYKKAAVCEFIAYTALTKLKRMDGEKVWRMGNLVRSKCVNVYNPIWKNCVGPTGQCPSGKDWDWVRKHMLVLLHRRSRKDPEPLELNAGEQQFATIFMFVTMHCYVCNSLCLTYRFGRIAYCHSRRATLLGSWSAAPVVLFYVLRPWPKSDRPHNVPQHTDASGAESST